MPELPEAELVRSLLEKTCTGRKIAGFEVRDARILDGVDPSDLEERLIGHQIESALRHGKRIFLGAQDIWLTIHLGMTGWAHYLDEPSPGRPETEPAYTRLLIRFEHGSLAYTDPRLFGRIGITDHPNRFIKQKRLGPDALEVSLEEFLQGLKKRRVCIKTALLDQHFVAGLGNLYADEALFQAGLHPEAKAHSLEDYRLSRLFKAVREVLSTAISSGSDFDLHPESYLLPHRHHGGKCPIDGSDLEIVKVNGRTTYFCQKHQT